MALYKSNTLLEGLFYIYFPPYDDDPFLYKGGWDTVAEAIDFYKKEVGCHDAQIVQWKNNANAVCFTLGDGCLVPTEWFLKTIATQIDMYLSPWLGFVLERYGSVCACCPDDQYCLFCMLRELEARLSELKSEPEPGADKGPEI